MAYKTRRQRITEDDPRWKPNTMGNKRSGKRSGPKSNNRLDESRTVPNRYTSWQTMTPPQKRGVMRNPQQHTPNPSQRTFTFRYAD